MIGVNPAELFVLCLAIVIIGTPVAILVMLRRRWGAKPGLIKCPDCQRYISRIAAACPGCGRPL